MLKLCSELHAAGDGNKSLSPDKRSRRGLEKAVSRVKTPKAKTAGPQLLTPYEMARRLSASAQGFVLRDYILYDLSLTLKKGGKDI